jgi:hypothetical protein
MTPVLSNPETSRLKFFKFLKRSSKSNLEKREIPRPFWKSKVRKESFKIL